MKTPTDRGPRWTPVPFEVFREINPGAATSVGVLEVLGQLIDLRWQEPGVVQHRHVYVPPSVLQKGNSSCIMASLEGASPQLSADSLNDLADDHDVWVVWNEAPDSCSPNLRVQAYRASMLGPRVLYAPGRCVGHGVHR